LDFITAFARRDLRHSFSVPLYEAQCLAGLNRIDEARRSATAVSVGCRVAHAKFGVGTVTRIEKVGREQKLGIRFDSGEERVLQDRFVKRVE
jgi:hypothetical protein